MRNKLIALDLLLLAAIVWLGFRMRVTWQEARLRERALLARSVKPEAAPPFRAVPIPSPAPAVNYFDVAQKLLFSRDRNPTVVIETPPPKQRPPLPLAHGFMNFGEPQIILSEKPGAAQKIYRIGDTIGDFKVLAVNRRNITLEWDGQSFETALADMRPKQAAAEAAPPPSQPAAAPPPATAANTLGSGTKSGPGVSMGSENRACIAGDTASAGTVQDGYKKVVRASPFGDVCFWEPTAK
jgi:hypothetical protein